MGCTGENTLAGISFSCSDINTGGLKSIYLCHKADLTATVVDGVVSADDFAIDAGKMVKLEFNNKDAFTSFTDVKTVDPAGGIVAIPTVVVEFPKMTAAKRNELDAISNSTGFELVAFIEDAAGTYSCVGLDFGLYASTINGQSGTGRTDKNVYQLTLVGEEENLHYGARDVWSDVQAAAGDGVNTYLTVDFLGIGSTSLSQSQSLTLTWETDYLPSLYALRITLLDDGSFDSYVTDGETWGGGNNVIDPSLETFSYTIDAGQAVGTKYSFITEILEIGTGTQMESIQTGWFEITA